MSEVLKAYDDLLKKDGPAAIVLKQPLMPVEGKESVVFPPTYAASKGEADQRPRYNLDPLGGGENDRYICSLDSVGSQANRVEPLFKTETFRHLVPQVTVTHGEGSTHLLDAGHRIADAIVRFSELLPEIHNAFIAYRDGNPEPMARLAPTSLVFGAWDSRGTQVKIPRLITLRIQAENVQKQTRSAQYTPATDYVANGLIDEVDENTGSDLGFAAVPASGQLGGVRVFGGIVRSGNLNLATLQSLGGGPESADLQRYVLGLALVCLTAFENSAFTLRQGCQLVADPECSSSVRLVFADGKTDEKAISPDDALKYATIAAKAFGVAEDRVVSFDSAFANRVRGAWSDKKKQEKLKELAKKHPLTMAAVDELDKTKSKK